MECPFCGKELLSGKVFSGGRMSGISLSFVGEGEKRHFKDIFRNTGRDVYIPPTQNQQKAYFCEECRKIIIGFDVD